MGVRPFESAALNAAESDSISALRVVIRGTAIGKASQQHIPPGALDFQIFSRSASADEGIVRGAGVTTATPVPHSLQTPGSDPSRRPDCRRQTPNCKRRAPGTTTFAPELGERFARTVENTVEGMAEHPFQFFSFLLSITKAQRCLAFSPMESSQIR